VLLYFLTEDGFKNNPKRLKIKYVWFFEGCFSVDETVLFYKKQTIRFRLTCQDTVDLEQCFPTF